jgi:hypothetical protein
MEVSHPWLRGRKGAWRGDDQGRASGYVGNEDTKEEEREEDSDAEGERERLEVKERTLLATKTARVAKENELWQFVQPWDPRSPYTTATATVRYYFLIPHRASEGAPGQSGAQAKHLPVVQALPKLCLPGARGRPLVR